MTTKLEADNGTKYVYTVALQCPFTGTKREVVFHVGANDVGLHQSMVTKSNIVKVNWPRQWPMLYFLPTFLRGFSYWDSLPSNIKKDYRQEKDKMKEVIGKQLYQSTF